MTFLRHRRGGQGRHGAIMGFEYGGFWLYIYLAHSLLPVQCPKPMYSYFRDDS